jgi:hypothetical protein
MGQVHRGRQGNVPKQGEHPVPADSAAAEGTKQPLADFGEFYLGIGMVQNLFPKTETILTG